MVSCMRLLASLSFLNFSSAGWLTMLERIFTIVPVFWGPCSALHRPYFDLAHTYAMAQRLRQGKLAGGSGLHCFALHKDGT